MLDSLVCSCFLSVVLHTALLYDANFTNNNGNCKKNKKKKKNCTYTDALTLHSLCFLSFQTHVIKYGNMCRKTTTKKKEQYSRTRQLLLLFLHLITWWSFFCFFCFVFAFIIHGMAMWVCLVTAVCILVFVAVKQFFC